MPKVVIEHNPRRPLEETTMPPTLPLRWIHTVLALASTITFLPAVPVMADGSSEKRPPNLVILYADDAGYADFGFQDHVAADMRGLTPHIDAIAAAGARCTNAYMSGAVCSPSRAGMLTGRYQQRFGHELNIPPGYMKGGMALSEKTIADRLRAVGYRTGIIGKWHLGYPPPYQPNRRGFDEFFGLLQGSRPYFPMKKVTPHRVLQHNGKPTPEEGYVTDRIGDGAVRRGRWKLVLLEHTPQTEPRLYDLDSDISETTDVASRHPEIVKSLRRELAEWESELISPKWGSPRRKKRRAHR